MVAKAVITGIFLLFASAQGMAVEVAPYDLRLELQEAVVVKEVRVVQAHCEKTAQDSCAEATYAVDIVRQYKGNRDVGRSLREKAGLAIGSRYLYYRVKRKLSAQGRPKLVSIFVPISSQPYFDGAQWQARDWLFLPKDLEARSWGSRKLPKNSCFADLDQATTIRVCDVINVLEYVRVTSLLSRAEKVSAKKAP